MRVINAIAVALLLVFACPRRAEPENRDPHVAQLAAANHAALPSSLHRRDGADGAADSLHRPLLVALPAWGLDVDPPVAEIIARVDGAEDAPVLVRAPTRSSRGPPRRSWS